MIYESFGKMVSMVIIVLGKIVNFILFMIYWMAIFSLLSKIVSIEVDASEYPGVNEPIRYFLHFLKTSVGDPEAIVYNKWVIVENAETGRMTDLSRFMMLVCWIVWSGNLVFNSIILMNLFISIVSLAFEEV